MADPFGGTQVDRIESWDPFGPMIKKNPDLRALNPHPKALNPNPEPLKPAPKALNPNPQTPKPQPLEPATPNTPP